MDTRNFAEASEFLRNNLRLRTAPVAVRFLKDKKDVPEKTRRPAQAMGKRVAVCQAVTMARLYGWTVGLAKEDMACVPAAIAFGMSDAEDSAAALARLFCGGSYSASEDAGRAEAETIHRLGKNEYEAIVLAPLARAAFEPDTIAVYGNPAQLMRLVHAWTYRTGRRVPGNFGGKVECTEYLLAPFRTGAARIAVPGTGDRVFSLTQDDELVFSFPGAALETLVGDLREAGKKVGASYPIPVFLNFQPEFPPLFRELGKELGVF
jgi:uncharacterized protein (DUF169 family)